MQPYVPGVLRHEPGLDLDIRPWPPAGIEAVFGNQRLFHRLAGAEVHPIVGKAEHAVETRGGKMPVIRFDIEGITGGIDEFRIFFLRAAHPVVLLSGG
ncbi:hypothetical protein D3C78_1098640 [compost metagenome]